MKYDIYLDGQIVGHCTVTEEGLYYRFQCLCGFWDKKIYKIFVDTDQHVTPLGICVPQGSDFYLEKRIPKRKIGQGSLRCYAQRLDVSDHTEDVLILSKLQQCYLKRTAEGRILAFRDRSEAPQGNDQSP